MSSAQCTLVITASDDVAGLLDCLQAVVASTHGIDYEVVVVFRQDTPSARQLATQLEGDVTLLWNDNDPGLPQARDQGAQAATTELLIFLDEQVRVEEHWLVGLVQVLASAGVGMAAPRVRMHDGSLQSSPKTMSHALAIRRSLLSELGGFSSSSDGTGDESELCRRVEAAGTSLALASTSVVRLTPQASPWQPADAQERRWGAHVHPLTEVRGRHQGKDIWIIASGASLSWVEPAFFANKVTIGLNQVYRKYPVDYLIRKEHSGAQRVVDTGIPVFIAKRNFGSVYGPPALRGEWWEYDHPINLGEAPPDLSAVGSEDQLTVSWSTITTAMHLAAYMGAANIMLCGHDAGAVDAQLNYPGYYEGLAPDAHDPFDSDSYAEWLTNIEAQSMAVRDALTAEYGCSVHSLNPFLTLNLEGHVFRGGSRGVLTHSGR